MAPPTSQKAIAAASLRQATLIAAQRALTRVTGKSFLLRALGAWRAALFGSKRGMHKYSIRVLYLISQRHYTAVLTRRSFAAWQSAKIPFADSWIRPPPGLPLPDPEEEPPLAPPPPRRKRWALSASAAPASSTSSCHPHAAADPLPHC